MKGITVTLYTKTKVGTDPAGSPIYTESAEEVENVLVSPTTSEDMISEMDLYGKHSVYTLAIPKGDTHDWRNKKVGFFGEIYKTFDKPVKGIDHLVPMGWNTKVKVEQYE